MRWSGTDEGSGIAEFTVFVSEDRGPFTPFVIGTTATSAVFTGKPGKSYRFLSQARDAAGNLEDSKTVAEAITAIIVRRGDLNGDGAISIPDLILLIQILQGIAPANAAADVNGDGSVNVGDLIRLIQHLQGVSPLE